MTRSISTIACEIKACWPNPFYGAVPYLNAMLYLNTLDDTYGSEDAKTQVIYFLSNATTWRGEDARRIKAELKQIAGLK